MLLSLPFLLATFVVYGAFSELRNLHGKSLMCHVGAMIAAYVALVLVQFRVGINNIPVCKCLGESSRVESSRDIAEQRAARSKLRKIPGRDCSRK